MKLLQFAQPERGSRLGLVKSDEVFDLTACAPYPASLHDLYYRHGGNKNGIASTVESINIRNAPRLSLNDLLNNGGRPQSTTPHQPGNRTDRRTTQTADLAGWRHP